MTYKYDVIPLTEGLDFNTATSLSKPGSLRDCMNYEFVDGAGLRRIDGFRPYDGTNLINRDKVFVLDCGASVSSDTVFSKPSWLYLENSVSNPNKVPFGQIFWNSTTLPSASGVSYVPFLKLNCPSYADPFFNDGTIKVLNSSALSVAYIPDNNQIQTTGQISNAVFNAIFGTTTQNAKTEKLQFDSHDGDPLQMSFVSNNIVNTTTAPFGGRSSPTAITDVWVEDLRGVTYSIGDAVVATGTTAKQVYVGDYMYTDGIFLPWLVLKSTLLTGTWGSGTARLEMVPLSYYGYVSGTNDSYKALAESARVRSELRLYRDSAADAMTSVTYQNVWYTQDVEQKAETAVIWTRHSEEAALTASTVYGTDSNGITGGTGHSLIWSGGASTGVKFEDANLTAEYMPLVAGGVIKAVIPTKGGSGYSGTGTVTYTAGTGGASGANTTYRSNCIERVYPRFLHTGWIVPFENGNKANGFFNKINRYKDTDSNSYSTTTVSGKTCTQYIHNIQNSTVPYSGTSNSARIFNDQWKTTSGSATDSASIVSAISANDGTTITNSYDWGRFSTSSVAYTSTSGLIGFAGLEGAIPEDSIIRGITVTARVEITASTDSSTIYTDGGATIRASLFKNSGAVQLGSPLEMLSASGSLKDTWSANTLTETAFTAGSSTNTWGNTPLKLEDLIDPTFGVSFDIRLDRNSSAVNPTGTFIIDQVTLTVDYELPSVRLYFCEGSGGGDAVISGDVLDYVISKGSLEAGDAEGYLTVVNVRTLHGASGATKAFYSILDNYYIYNNPALTSLVGRVSGDMQFNGCDSYRTIKAQGSLYTCHRANLYSNADYDTFFICSGAGRARQFDGKYLSKIYAINPSQSNSEDLDKPRHCTVKNFSLFLGYESGQVLFSAPGDPANFSAFDGAGEIGIGDNVVGLQNMPGNSLCVACRNSMHAIVGTSAQDYSLQTLVADEGAYEYSVCAAGGRILYTSPSGVTTLDQSEKYGNFTGRRLSFAVNPWLLPRINVASSAFKQPSTSTSPSDGGTQFARAHAVPHKNQYRLYFKDGAQLWMTLIEGAPQFTFAKYHFAHGIDQQFLDWGAVGPVVPLYVTTTLEKDPHLPYKTLACFDPEIAIRFGSSAGYTSGHGLWHLDAGDYFVSQGPVVSYVPIPCWFAVNYNYLQNPFQSKTIKKVRLEGQTMGYAPFTVYTMSGYKSELETAHDASRGTPCNLPETTLTESLPSYVPEATMANVASTGRVITVLFVSKELGDVSSGTTLADEHPISGTTSHLAQALFVQYEEGKEDA